MISGCRRGRNVVFTLLGCYAASIGNYWPTFEATYRFYLQG